MGGAQKKNSLTRELIPQNVPDELKDWLLARYERHIGHCDHAGRPKIIKRYLGRLFFDPAMGAVWKKLNKKLTPGQVKGFFHLGADVLAPSLPEITPSTSKFLVKELSRLEASLNTVTETLGLSSPASSSLGDASKDYYTHDHFYRLLVAETLLGSNFFEAPLDERSPIHHILALREKTRAEKARILEGKSILTPSRFYSRKAHGEEALRTKMIKVWGATFRKPLHTIIADTVAIIFPTLDTISAESVRSLIKLQNR